MSRKPPRRPQAPKSPSMEQLREMVIRDRLDREAAQEFVDPRPIAQVIQVNFKTGKKL